MKDYPQPKDACPSCGYVVDTATGGHHHPRPGDIGLCLSCGVLNCFGQDLSLQTAPANVLDGVTARHRRMLEVAQEFIRKRGPIVK